MVYPGCGIELDWDFATKGVLRVVVLNYSIMFRQD